LITKAFLGEDSSEDYGSVEINGLLDGTINNARKVTITPSGSLYGRVTAREVEIAGLVDGDIETESLIVHPSGQLHYGRLKYSQMLTEDGSTVISKSKGNNEFRPEIPVKSEPDDELPDKEWKCEQSLLDDTDSCGHFSLNDYEAELPQNQAFPLKVDRRNRQLQFYSSY